MNLELLSKLHFQLIHQIFLVYVNEVNIFKDVAAGIRRSPSARSPGTFCLSGGFPKETGVS